MGALQCEVRVLKDDRPLLVSWENPVKKMVECIVVTCHCQKLDLECGLLEEIGHECPSPAMDGAWASRLASSLENADVVSFTSLDECRTVFSLTGHDEEGSPDIISEAQMGKCPKQRRKKSLQKEATTQTMPKIEVLIAGLKHAYQGARSNPSPDSLSTGPGGGAVGLAVDGLLSMNQDPGKEDLSGLSSQSRSGDGSSTERGRSRRDKDVGKEEQRSGSSVVYNILKGLSGSVTEKTGGTSGSSGRSQLSSGVTDAPDPIVRNLDHQSETDRTVPPDCGITTIDRTGANSPSEASHGASTPEEGSRKEVTHSREGIAVSSGTASLADACDNSLPFHDILEASRYLGTLEESSSNISSGSSAPVHSNNYRMAEAVLKLDSLETSQNSPWPRRLDNSSHHNIFDIRAIDPELRGAALNLASLENLEVIPGHFASTDAADSALPEENALMRAIDSMMETMNCQNSDQSNTVQTGPADRGQNPENPPRISVPSTHVEFIRNLTDEERKKMFNFRSDIDERNRRALETGEGAYLCEYCGRALSLKAIRGHMKTHEKSRERKHICDICGKAFLSNFALKNHLKTHDPNTTYKCRHCPKSYRSKFGRTIHERLHFGVYPETCEKCGAKFNERHKLKLHMENSHGEEGTGGLKKAAPRKTTKSDSDTKTCHICNKVLRAMSFRQHIEMHNGRMFTCPTCGKVMGHATRFSHLKLHTLKKDFKCSHCEKSFVSKQSLTNHERTHTGERHLKCRYCDRKFGSYSSREVHENAHTGARPYKCTICDKAWKDRSSYRTHMQKKHPGEPLFYKRRTAEINSKRGPNWVMVSNAE